MFSNETSDEHSSLVFGDARAVNIHSVCLDEKNKEWNVFWCPLRILSYMTSQFSLIVYLLMNRWFLEWRASREDSLRNCNLCWCISWCLSDDRSLIPDKHKVWSLDSVSCLTGSFLPGNSCFETKGSSFNTSLQRNFLWLSLGNLAIILKDSG